MSDADAKAAAPASAAGSGVAAVKSLSSSAEMPPTSGGPATPSAALGPTTASPAARPQLRPSSALKREAALATPDKAPKPAEPATPTKSDAAAASAGDPKAAAEPAAAAPQAGDLTKSAEPSGVQKVAAMSKKASGLQRAVGAKSAAWETLPETPQTPAANAGAPGAAAAPVHAVLGAAGALSMPPMPSPAQQYPGTEGAHEEFNTWTGAADPPAGPPAAGGDAVRVTELAVWGDEAVIAVQVTCEVTKPGGGAPIVVVSPAPPPALVGGALPRRVALRPGEFITCVNVWSSDRHGAVRKQESWGLGYASYGAIGSLSVTLSSCRVFRFGASWHPGCQHSICAPSFDKTIPAGSHIIGFCGERSGGLVSRLGVMYAPGAAGPAAPPRPYAAQYNAVSLKWARRFYDAVVKQHDDAAKERARAAGGKPALMTTDEVAKEVIMAATWDMESGRALRFADTMEPADLWGGPSSGQDAFFASHAFGNPFELLLVSLEAHFSAAGATPESVYLWFDIFAINQADPGVDLDAGRTLSATIDVATNTLVVLDQERAMPLTRLWCLYEIGFTPQDKLMILTHGYSKDDITKAFAVINVSEAQCFDMTAKEHIHKKIKEQHGSLERFTEVLKLRLLLKPLSYDGDINALLARSDDVFDLDPIRRWASEAAAEPRLMCVSASSGEGKSTLSAALTRLPSAGPGVVRGALAEPPEGDAAEEATARQAGASLAHAWHFCKHSDARRQDGVMVAKSLAYQLGLRFPSFAQALLALDAKAVAGLQRADEALAVLVLRPLARLPSGTRAIVLIDALDEADPPGSSSALANPLLGAVTALHGAGCLVVATTRPQPPHIVQALERLAGGAFEKKPVGAFLKVPEKPPKEAREGGGEAAAAVQEAWRVFFAANVQHKIFCTVAAFQMKLQPGTAPPASLAAAYASVFEHGWPKDAAHAAAVTKLLQVVMAAREPPSVAALEQLRVRGAMAALPGRGVLFSERDFHVYTIHKSLAEWLKGAIAVGDGEPAVPTPERFVVDVRAGDRVWAAHCGALALGKKALAASVDGYSLRYVIQHMSNAKEAAEWALLGKALLDFVFWEAVFQAGELEHALVRDVAAAAERAAAEGAGGAAGVAEARAAGAAARDVLRWLLADGRFMRQRPSAVAQRAFAAPAGSSVAKAARANLDGPPLQLMNPVESWPHEVMAVQAPDDNGGSGGSSFVGATFSPDGSQLLLAAGANVVVSDPVTGQRIAALQSGAGKSPITTCAWAGSTIATAANPEIRLWDGSTGACTLQIPWRADYAHSIALSPDGNLLAACSGVSVTIKGARAVEGAYEEAVATHRTRVFDCATGAVLHRLEGGATDEKTWSDGSASKDCGNAQVAFSPCGKLLAAGDYGGNVWPLAARVWSTETWQLLHTLPGHSRDINCLAFSEDSAALAVANDDNLKLWNPTTGMQLMGISCGSAHVVAFSTSCDRMAWGSRYGDVTILDGWAALAAAHAAKAAPTQQEAGKSYSELNLPSSAYEARCTKLIGHSGQIEAIAFSPGSGGGRLMSASKDATLRVWELPPDAAAAAAAAEAEAPSAAPCSPRSAERLAAAATERENAAAVCVVAVSPCGTGVATGTGERAAGKAAWLWDAATAAPIAALSGVAAAAALSFSPDGSALLAAGHNLVRIYDSATGAVREPPPPPDAPEGHDAGDQKWKWGHSKSSVCDGSARGMIYGAGWAPDGRCAVSCGRDGVAILWDGATGRQLERLPHCPPGHDEDKADRNSGPRYPVRSAAFSADAKLVATAGEHERAVRPHNSGGAAAEAPPVAETPQLLLWAVEGGARRRAFAVPADERLFAVAFSPDSAAGGPGDSTGSGGSGLLASGSDGGGAWCTVRLWSVRSGEQLHSIDLASSPCTALSFSPNGRRLLAASLVHKTPGFQFGIKRERCAARVLRVPAQGGAAAGGAGEAGEAPWEEAELEHAAHLTSVQWALGGAAALTASVDGTAKLWSLSDAGPEGETRKGPAGGAFRALAASPSAETFFCSADVTSCAVGPVVKSGPDGPGGGGRSTLLLVAGLHSGRTQIVHASPATGAANVK